MDTLWKDTVDVITKMWEGVKKLFTDPIGTLKKIT